jgi:DNA-binding transcriptional regulator YiaG
MLVRLITHVNRNFLLTRKISVANIGAMNNISAIRKQLGMSQADFGAAIGVTAGNVSHYERQAQEVPPGVARRVIAVAAERGVIVCFDDIYGAPGVDEAA